MKAAFFDLLERKAHEDDRVSLVTIDLGFNAVEAFSKNFPDRFWNLGITEQSSMGVAAGLAAAGYVPFVYSIANFTTFRAAEQIRNDIAYENNSVKIVSAGGGAQYGALGYSHHAIQDFGLIRLFPNLTICAPTTITGLKLAMEILTEERNPGYLRLSVESSDFEAAFHLDPKSSDLPEKCVLVTGDLGSKAKGEIEKLLREGFELVLAPIWGPANALWFSEKLSQVRSLISFETHLAGGGFGSWLLELRNDHNLRFDLRRFVIHDSIIGQVGSRDFLLRQHSGYSDAGVV